MATIKVKGGAPENHDGNVAKAIAASPNHDNTPVNPVKPRRLRLS